MGKFYKYKRTNVAEMRRYEKGEVLPDNVSISEQDKLNGSPKEGDMIARNPYNHEDKWLVANAYFRNNFEPLDSVTLRNIADKLNKLYPNVMTSASRTLNHFSNGNSLAVYTAYIDATNIPPLKFHHIPDFETLDELDNFLASNIEKYITG